MSCFPFSVHDMYKASNDNNGYARTYICVHEVGKRYLYLVLLNVVLLHLISYNSVHMPTSGKLVGLSLAICWDRYMYCFIFKKRRK